MRGVSLGSGTTSAIAILRTYGLDAFWSSRRGERAARPAATFFLRRESPARTPIFLYTENSMIQQEGPPWGVTRQLPISLFESSLGSIFQVGANEGNGEITRTALYSVGQSQEEGAGSWVRCAVRGVRRASATTRPP